MKKQTDNGGSANSNKKAAALLADASRIMQGVIKYVTNPDEAESFQEIFEAYGKARNNIERILTEYPASIQAAELTSGKTRISDFTLVKFRELGNLLKRLAAAGRSQVACILFIADTINDAREKALALSKIAQESAESRKKQGAIQALSKAIDTTLTIDYTGGQIELLNKITKKYGDIGETQEVLRLLSQAQKIADTVEDDASQKDYLLQDIANAGAATRHFDRAIEIAETIGNSKDKTESLQDIAKNCAAAGHFDRAIEITDTIGNSVDKDWTLRDIAKDCASAGEFDRGVEIARTINNASRKNQTLSEIAQICAAAGQCKQAVEISRLIRNPDVKTFLMRKIAEEFAAAGEFDRAIEIAEAIEYLGSKVKTLTEVAEECIKAGQFDRAAKIAETFGVAAVAAAKAKEEVDERISGLSKIANKFADAGQLDRALEAFKTINKSTIHPEDLFEFAKHLAAAGGFDQAVKIAKSIKDKGYKAEALGKIAVSYADAGKKQKALQLLSQALKIADAYGELWTLIEIAGRYIELGEKQEANLILSEVYDAIETDYEESDDCEGPYDYENVGTLIRIADQYAAAGEKKQADKILTEALGTAVYPDNAEFLSQELSDIADRFAADGQYEYALDTLKAIPIGECVSITQEEALVKLSNRYVETGQFIQAFETCMAIKLEDSRRAETFNLIVDSFAKTEDKYRTELILPQAISAATTFGSATEIAEALMRIALKFAKSEPQLGNNDFTTFHNLVSATRPYILFRNLMVS